MKKLTILSVISVLMFFAQNLFSQTIILSNEVKGMWTKVHSPYIVLRDITVPADTSLSIEPGVEVQFATGFGLTVKGNLLAIGNSNDKITFTSADTVSVKNDSTLGWKGISIIGGNNDTSVLENCILEYVYKFSSVDYQAPVSVIGRHAAINKCNIKNNIGNYSGGICCVNEADVSILNSVISDNSGNYYGGIYISKSNALVANNLILNGKLGICIYGKNAASDTVRCINNTIVQNNPFNNYQDYKMVINQNGLLKMQNCIIWDNTNTYKTLIAVYSSYNLFENCIIKYGKSNIYSDNSNNIFNNVYEVNPLFVDFQNKNFHLSNNSCGINSGMNLSSEILSLIPNDLSGNPRIFNDTVDIIDIGAYEYQGDIIANRPPSINNPGTTHVFFSSSKEMTFSFTDVDESDSHTLSVNTDNPNISLSTLSAQTNNAKYTITPVPGWIGKANVILSVSDNHGAKDIDTFAVIVNDTVNYDITENTVWNIDTVFIGSSFKVSTGANLEIHPGTCIRFMGNYNIEADGNIKAIGTTGNKIRFTSADTSGFSRNVHKGWGGIIFKNVNDSSIFENCVFEYVKNNKVFLLQDNTNVEILNSVFCNNNNPNNAYFEIEADNSKIFIGNSLFYDNKPGSSTIYASNSDVELYNNDFFNNTGSFSTAHLTSGNALIKNCIFWNDPANNGYEIYSSSLTNFDITNCLIKGGESKFKDYGSIINKKFIYDTYPKFIDSLNRDFRLLSNSPCINTGVNDTWLARLNNIDFAGNDRIYNGTVLLPDIGAYEYQGNPSNRPPVIEKVEDKTAMLGIPVTDTINFFDADAGDTHTITVKSNNANVTVQNLSGDTSGSVYKLVPAPGFTGDALISVIVKDNGGLQDSVSYNLQVSRSACGNIYEDMLWDKDTIQVVCDVTVEKGATLTIKPGVKVIFNGPYVLNVQGTLKANGAVNDTIRFVLSDTITFNQTVYANAWRGIKLDPEEGQDTSELRFCEIRNSKDRGIELDYYSRAVITNCNIHHNLSDNYEQGAGIYNYSDFSVIENNYIHHNKSAYDGGGIYIGNIGSKIKNNIISYNTANSGGGICTSYSGKCSIIEGNTIENNQATTSTGGGIYSGAGDTIKNNIIRNNYSQSAGGGIEGYKVCYIINNLIEGNKCGSSCYGGGIYLAAGSFNVINNVIINNYASAGGSGLFLSSAGGLLANNTICKNIPGTKGNAVYLTGNQAPVMVNNILWGNESPVSKSEIYIDNELSQPIISYSVIEGGKENISCSANIYFTNEYENNINKYPDFSDTAVNNFNLTDSSLCINSGTLDTVGMNIPKTDIAGHARIYSGSVKRIDIGAYEYEGEPVNRHPVLNDVANIQLFSSQTKQMKVDYFDADEADTHTLKVESNESHLAIKNLSGDTTGSTYDIVAAPGWLGSAEVKVSVEDSHGLKDSVYYSVNVSDSVCGNITDNLIWDKDTVFVTCNITIPEGNTLTILPGTVVLFKGNSHVDIYGTLIVEGTQQHRIVLISNDTSATNNHWGGIYFYKNTVNSDTSKLSYCIIKYGRNLNIQDNKVIVSNCFFNNCYADNGGGIYILNSSPLIENCKFTNNAAYLTGGAISCIDKDYFDTYQTNPVIIGNEIYSNHANNGGAIYSYGTGAIINNNVIHNNTANYGGGFELDGEGNNPVLQNNLIYKNTAIYEGGAIYYNNSWSSFQINNTIVKNKSGKGGALNIQSYSFPQIYNDIIYYNVASQNGQQVYLYDNESRPGFFNCFIQYGFDSITGGGAGQGYTGLFKNILSVDPLFVDSTDDNYQLSDSSFCINAGTMNIKGMLLPEHDITGNARVFAGTLANIDVGAYEFQGNPKNRKPCIEHIKDQYTFISARKKLSVTYTDVDKTDTHIITISTGSPNVTVENKSGDISGSTYDLVPAIGWKGVSEIYVKVEDDKGNFAIDTFNLIVSEYYCGSIAENTTWGADTIKIACDVTVENGATLNILPGTVISFDDNAQLKVLGRLLAVGTKEQKITFTSSDMTGYPGANYKGWRGIRFYGPNNSDTSKLVYCKIQYAKGIDKSLAYDSYGGGLFINNWYRILVSNCQISNNTAVERGGGIYCNASNGIIVNNITSNNHAQYGGGLYYSDYYLGTYLINNIICNNLADYYGGGIYSSGLYSFNNLIVNNSSNYSGGLYIDGGQLYNTIIWGNTASYYPNLYVSYNYISMYNGVLQNGLTNIGYSSEVKVYEKMIEQNPQFVSTSQGTGTAYNGLTANWSLRASSPCINKGKTNMSSLYEFEFPGTDIAGENRILMDSIDIGAYEFRNIAPERTGTIPDLDINAGVPANVNIPVAGVFTDKNIGDVLTYKVAGINAPNWMNLSIAGENINITGTPGKNDMSSTKIAVTATDLFGATASDTFQITVTTGVPVNNIAEDSYDVYPIPAKEAIYIEGLNNNRNKIIRVELFDLTGKALSMPEIKNEGDKLRIDVSSLPAGIYCLTIRNGSEIKTYKIPKL